jgi:ATP-dependent Zn protease
MYKNSSIAKKSHSTDGFGKFLKLYWAWIACAILIVWYVIDILIPQITPPTPNDILTYAIQIGFALLLGTMQFVAIFWFLGRPRLYWVMPGETGVGFKDYKGNPEVLEAASRIVKLLRGARLFERMGGQPIRGLLLLGPPGTGKSYLAQCVSTEAGLPFAYVSAASFRAMFIGMDVLMIRRLYAKARRYARKYGGCIVFLDEIDAIGMARSSPVNGVRNTGTLFGSGGGGLNQLLMELDPPSIETAGFRSILRAIGLYHGKVQSQPVLTIGATNMSKSLDAALLRPGRFDRHMQINPPTDKYRGEVIEYYLDKVVHDPTISISVLVQRMLDYTPVAMKQVINEAVITAHFAGRTQVLYKDIIEAQDTYEFGLRQISDLTPLERRRLAYHEAGHVVACYYTMERYFPAYVTLHRHGAEDNVEAFASFRPSESVRTMSAEEMLAQIQVSLAARASEELFLDTCLNSNEGDFINATNIAGMFVGLCGMDGTLISQTNTLHIEVPDFAERVERVLQEQFKIVKKLLKDHSLALIAVADALVDKDELLAEEIETLIDKVDASEAAKKALPSFAKNI